MFYFYFLVAEVAIAMDSTLKDSICDACVLAPPQASQLPPSEVSDEIGGAKKSSIFQTQKNKRVPRGQSET